MAEDSSVTADAPADSASTSPRTFDRAQTFRHYLWQPGQSGNPSGMQAPLRSFASHIRAETGYGKEIAAFYLAIMRGEVIKMPGKRITKRKNGRKIASIYVRPTLDQRIDAAAWLADRGWGKAKETIELTGEASPAQRLELLKRLSEEDRAQLRSLLQRALEPQVSNAAAIPAASNSSDTPSTLLQTPESVASEDEPQVPADPT